MRYVMNLSEYFSYDPETGIIRWIKRPKFASRCNVGSAAGTLREDGYLDIKVGGERTKAHRIAWFLYYGVWPTKMIDHINGDKRDNRISNLRECTNSENQQNRSKGDVAGISYHKRDRKWQVRISLNGIQEWVGSFVSKDKARDAYQKRKAELHTFNPVLR